MAYVVFARKWRPKTFSEVIGQAHITVTLENAIKKDRLASAYLFSGPRGVGKTTTARILAKAINCEKGPTTTPCNSCVSCTEITRSNSMDVLEIDGASNRGIDEIRNLREGARYAPAQGGFKIYIVDEVHMLTTEAFNALLKTLEEPPAHVKFIFATTENHKVPATILSRCQRFDFKRIAVPEIIQQLKLICQSEKIEIEDGALRLIAQKADGGMRDSESLLDQVVAFCGSTIKEEEVSKLVGMASTELYFEISDAILQHEVTKIMELSRTVHANGLEASTLLHGLAEHLNNILICKATGSTKHLQSQAELLERYSSAAQQFAEVDLIRLIQVAAEAAGRISRVTNGQLFLEITFVKLAKLTPTVELNELFAGIESLKKKAHKQSSPPQTGSKMSLIPEIDPGRVSGSLFLRLRNNQNIDSIAVKNPDKADYDSADGEEINIDFKKVIALWPKIVAAVKSRKIAIGSFLEEGKPKRLNGQSLEIQFSDEGGFHLNSINDNKVFIQKIMQDVVGAKLLLSCIRSDGNDAAETNGADEKVEAHQSAAEETSVKRPVKKNTIEDDPVVKMLVDSLDGEPVE